MKNRQSCLKWLAMVSLVFIVYTSSHAGSAPFLSPGIKIGYNFGKSHGFVLGFESSFGMSSWEPDDNNSWSFTGVVIGYSYCFNKQVNHYVYLEGEYGLVGLGGGSLGLLYSPQKSILNPYLRVFPGAFGYISFRYTLGQLPKELALVGKLPLSGNGPVLD